METRTCDLRTGEREGHFLDRRILLSRFSLSFRYSGRFERAWGVSDRCHFLFVTGGLSPNLLCNRSKNSYSKDIIIIPTHWERKFRCGLISLVILITKNLQKKIEFWILWTYTHHLETHTILRLFNKLSTCDCTPHLPTCSKDTMTCNTKILCLSTSRQTNFEFLAPHELLNATNNKAAKMTRPDVMAAIFGCHQPIKSVISICLDLA